MGEREGRDPQESTLSEYIVGRRLNRQCAGRGKCFTEYQSFARDENREWAGPLQAMQAVVRLQSTSELAPKCKCFSRQQVVFSSFFACFWVWDTSGTCPGRMHSPEKNACDRMH